MPRTDIDNPTQKPVLSDNLTTPPGIPVKGSRYIIAGTSGDWSGFTIGDIVEVLEDNPSVIWVNRTPESGWDVYVESVGKYKTWTGAIWVIGGITSLEELSDVSSATPTKYNILFANGTTFSSNSIRDLRSLALNYAKSGYVEYIRTSGLISSTTIWTNNGKTTKIMEETISRTNGKADSVVSVLYDIDGTTVLETFTETFNRTTGEITSVDLVLT